MNPNLGKGKVKALITQFRVGTRYLTLHFTALHFTSLHYIVLHSTILHYTTLHCSDLRFTALHYTTLLCLYSTDPPVLCSGSKLILSDWYFTPIYWITALYNTLHYWTTVYSTNQYCRALNNTSLHRASRHCTILQTIHCTTLKTL